VAIGDLGTVTVGLDANFSRKLVREMVLDIVVVVVVALCLTLEVLSFLSVASGASGDPLRNCRGIRAPAFLFFLSEELTRPFLPNFAGSLAPNVEAIPQHIVIGLPIVAFMLVVALTQPWLGAISQRIGNRRLLLFGTIPAIAGFMICALATDIYLFVAARMICALGYAAIFVSAQGHILHNTDESSRSAGFALLVGAIMVATICGPSVGGILADNIGARATFGVAAVVAALAIPLMTRLAGSTPGQARDSSGAVRLSDLLQLARNRRFLALCVNAAIPAKILLTGYCFFLLPLYIVSIGSTQAMAGRLLMVYATFMVLLVPIASRCADRFRAWTGFILAGLLVSALGGLLAIGLADFGLSVGLVSALGIGQAMSITAQSTLVSAVAAEEIALLGSGYVYGIYRLIERMGNAAGPLLAGSLLAMFGFKAAFVCLGVLTLLSALTFHVLVARPREGRRTRMAVA
jgi:MFS family permease